MVTCTVGVADIVLFTYLRSLNACFVGRLDTSKCLLRESICMMDRQCTCGTWQSARLHRGL
jgi:hypothetical protein